MCPQFTLIPKGGECGCVITAVYRDFDCEIDHPSQPQAGKSIVKINGRAWA
jgi:hypothetical protein